MPEGKSIGSLNNVKLLMAEKGITSPRLGRGYEGVATLMVPCWYAMALGVTIKVWPSTCGHQGVVTINVHAAQATNLPFA